jgi:hypothetical protein
VYKFIREDNGEVVEVGFEAHMNQDCAGWITLPDGVRARRSTTYPTEKSAALPSVPAGVPLPSDAMGFTAHQIVEFEADKERHGYQGVEFKPDPQCPDFYQVHFSSYKARDAYIAHRGLVDRCKTSGVSLTPTLLREAQERAKQMFAPE